LNKSFLQQNVPYYYVLKSNDYDFEFEFVDNNTKLNIYTLSDKNEPFYVIKFKQNEIDNFAKFFKSKYDY
jgi:hypothetical protein